MTTFEIDATVETVETSPHPSIWPGEIVDAIWETDQKDQLTVLCKKEDGHTTTLQTSEGTIHWDDYFSNFTANTVDLNTEKHHRTRLESIERDKKHREKLDKMKDLFTAKLQAFEIPEIKNCTDKELRARIRKAKNPIEVSALASIIISRSL